MGQGLFSSSGKMFGTFQMHFSEVEKVGLKSSVSEKKKNVLGRDHEPRVNILGTSFRFLFFLIFTRKLPYSLRKMKKYTFQLIYYHSAHKMYENMSFLQTT